VQLTPAYGNQDLGMPTGRACGANSLVGDGFGEVELAQAEDEHRGERPLQVELPRVDFAQVSEQLGLDGVAATDQVMCPGQEFLVVECLESSSHAVASSGRTG